MPKLSTFIALSAALSLGGCASWAPQGHGGMAEHHQQTLSPVMSDEPLGPEHGLRFDLELTSRHLDILVLEGAELCFPATVVQAKQRQNRISRELQGDLNFDAANDLIVQRNLLARLERQLDYVRQQDVCILTTTEGESKPGETSKQIAELLNADNQFALDSSEINPKYVGRLAEAVHLLRDLPQYNLLITGHADATGELNHNQTLSMARAEQVGRYLQILGLAVKRIQFDAVGSNDPLFEGAESHVRLVNRRVSIELIERKNTDEHE